MFATLVGTSIEGGNTSRSLNALCALAGLAGYTPADTSLRVQPDQTPLQGWSLFMKGPLDGQADFVLAVTAPKTPSISPVPVRLTVSEPLFAVVVLRSAYVVSREDERDVSEFKDLVDVEQSFKSFLGSVPRS